MSRPRTSLPVLPKELLAEFEEELETPPPPPTFDPRQFDQPPTTLVPAHRNIQFGQAKRKHLHAYLDFKLGLNAGEAFDFAIQVMRGEVKAPARKPGAHEDAASAALIPDVPPTIAERFTAAKWLAEMRNGKPQKDVTVNVDDSIAKARKRDIARLSDADLELAEKLLEKAEVVEVELVSSEDRSSENE